TSTAFNITAAAADHLGFGVQPSSNTVAGVAISPAVTVRILDVFGNLVTNDNSDQVTLSVASGPGGFAGSSTLTATASGGIATFRNLFHNTAGTYTLRDRPTQRSSDPTSAGFTVTAAAADHLGFGVQPSSNTVAGTAITPAVTVRILDQFGNLVASDNSDQ